MRRFGLLGFPLTHSYSAIMHNAAFGELGIDARYELFTVHPEKLEEKFKQLLAEGISGLNVTVPHKEKIVKFLHKLDQEARLIGAVNTIKVNQDKRTLGFNTDGLGFITHLKDVIGFNPQNKRVSILGAGGAAKACAAELAKNKAKGISLFDIDQKKTADLISQLKQHFPACLVSAVSQADALLTSKPDLLINATPIGMNRDEPLAFDASLLYPKLVVYDLIYNPAQTPLLQEAKRKGCSGVFNGLGMLLYQGALAFKIWLEIEPPLKAMEEALRNALEQ